MKHAIAALALCLAACGGSDDPPPAGKKPPEGRAETQSIRNTDAVGYGGSAVADKVDGALDKNEERAKKTEEASQQE